ncbi:MAG: phosphoglycolate phosphatase [Pseudomonadota bacterium]
MYTKSVEKIRECFDAIIFDLDGTLIDTAPDILAYLNEMLAELGRPGLDLERLRAMVGDGVRSLLLRGLEASGGVPGDVDIETLFHRYLERYTQDPVRLSRPYPGMIEVLEALSSVGLRLGVCTNKPQAPTDKLLKTLVLDHHFAVAIGGDALSTKKPDPAHLLAVLHQLDVDPARAVLIGDSATDLKTARAAGVPCILMSYGYSATPVHQLGAERVIDDAGALLDAIAALKTSEIA